jgi:hypothetical protein
MSDIRDHAEPAMLPRDRWHVTVTSVAVMEACDRRQISLDNPGICLACGFEQDGCEPDARGYECASCGEAQVFGSDEILMEML